MTRWFKHVAVLAAWLGLGTVVLAQPGYPSPVGATRIPEPIGYVPDQPPPTNMVPGPISPMMAPMGPPPSLNLPAGHTSAFQLDHFPPESAAYFAAGGMALMRQGLTNTTIVALDEQNRRLDTGISPVGPLPVQYTLDQLHPSLQGGYRATLGYLFADEAFELTGFWVPYATQSGSISDQGRLTVPFTPVNSFPLGFEGNNNIWYQADYVKTSFTGAVGSAEANYRRWNSGLNQIELITGVRYFYAQERVDIYTNDDFFTRDLFGNSDLLRAANYSVSSRNNYLGLQFGGEYSTPIPTESLSWIWFSAMAKTSLGGNFVERTFRMTRGDGFEGFNIRQNSIQFSSVNELGGYVDIHILERLRLRAGYMCLWAIGFSQAPAQIDFNLTTQGNRATDSRSIFWHGPMAELQFLF